MKFLSLFTHIHVVPNLYEFLSYVEHARRYFKNAGIQTLDETVWTTMKVNRDQQLFVLQNIFFCVQNKIETHTGLERHE